MAYINFKQAMIIQDIIISGIVTQGDKRGRDMGFPTANIKLCDTHRNIDKGVYAVKIFIDNQKYNGMANIGTHPTVGDADSRLLEVNIFDFNSDIYEKKIEVHLIKFIRSEVKFKSLDALIEQIKLDKEVILTLLR